MGSGIVGSRVPFTQSDPFSQGKNQRAQGVWLHRPLLPPSHPPHPHPLKETQNLLPPCSSQGGPWPPRAPPRAPPQTVLEKRGSGLNPPCILARSPQVFTHILVRDVLLKAHRPTATAEFKDPPWFVLETFTAPWCAWSAQRASPSRRCSTKEGSTGAALEGAEVTPCRHRPRHHAPVSGALGSRLPTQACASEFTRRASSPNYSKDARVGSGWCWRRLPLTWVLRMALMAASNSSELL